MPSMRTVRCSTSLVPTHDSTCCEAGNVLVHARSALRVRCTFDPERAQPAAQRRSRNLQCSTARSALAQRATLGPPTGSHTLALQQRVSGTRSRCASGDLASVTMRSGATSQVRGAASPPGMVRGADAGRTAFRAPALSRLSVGCGNRCSRHSRDCPESRRCPRAPR